jgi:hypothetical protein
MTAELNKHKSKEQLPTPDRMHEHHDAYHKPSDNTEKHQDYKDNPEKLESIRLVAEHHAKSKESHNIHQEQQPKHEQHHYLTKRIKRDVYKNTITDVQSHLSPSEKRFSKIVHNEFIESISEAGAKTIARPSGILGGSIIMVFGGLIVLFFARKYGFEVPLSLYLFLYLVGFILFVAVELISNPLKKFSKKSR